MKSFRIKERINILREFLYSGVSLNRRLDLVDAKLLLLLDEMVDVRQLKPMGGILRLKQETCFQILRILKRIADVESISFWLDFGTLLGAVRHGGFIPWDDDLDISLLRSDYERFCSLLPNRLPARLILVQGKTAEGGGIGIARVVEETTGFYVDLYPYNRIPGALRSDGRISKWQSNYATEYAKVFRLGMSHGWTDDIRRRIGDWEESYPHGDGDKEGIAVSMLYFLALPIYRRVFPSENVFPLSKAVFEGEEFSIPAQSERVLSDIYGDYMRFPKDAGFATHSVPLDVSPQEIRIVIDDLNEFVRVLDRN